MKIRIKWNTIFRFSNSIWFVLFCETVWETVANWWKVSNLPIVLPNLCVFMPLLSITPKLKEEYSALLTFVVQTKNPAIGQNELKNIRQMLKSNTCAKMVRKTMCFALKWFVCFSFVFINFKSFNFLPKTTRR